MVTPNAYIFLHLAPKVTGVNYGKRSLFAEDLALCQYMWGNITPAIAPRSEM